MVKIVNLPLSQKNFAVNPGFWWRVEALLCLLLLAATGAQAQSVVGTDTVGSQPIAVAVNPVTNKVYVTNFGDDTVTVIDGATNGTTTVAVGGNPYGVAVNPVTNKVYVANQSDSTVTVIDVDGSQSVPLAATSAIAANDPLTVSETSPYITRNIAPVFTATVTSAYSGLSVYSSLSVTNPPPPSLYYWVDDGSGSSSSAPAWIAAAVTTSGNPATFNLALANQSTWLHTLYYFAAYGDEGTPDSSSNGTGNSPEIGNLQQIVYEVLPATSSTEVTTDATLQNLGSRVTFTATVTPGTDRGSVRPTGLVYFYDGSTLLGSDAMVQNGDNYTAAYSTTVLTAGNHTITAIYAGDSNYASSSGTLAEEIAGVAANVSVVSSDAQSSTFGIAFALPLMVRVTDANNISVSGAAVTFTSTVMSFSSCGTATTDSNGLASITVTPTSVGTALLATATTTGVSTSTSFTESATAVTPTVTA